MQRLPKTKPERQIPATTNRQPEPNPNQHHIWQRSMDESQQKKTLKKDPS